MTEFKLELGSYDEIDALTGEGDRVRISEATWNAWRLVLDRLNLAAEDLSTCVEHGALASYVLAACQKIAEHRKTAKKKMGAAA